MGGCSCGLAEKTVKDVWFKGKNNWPGWAKKEDGDEDGQSHGGPWLDHLVGFLLVSGPALYGVAILCGDLMRVVTQFDNMAFTSLSLSRFANSISEIVCLSLVFFLWFTFCYFHDTDVQSELTQESRQKTESPTSPEDGLVRPLIADAKKEPTDTHSFRVGNFWSYKHAGEGSAVEWMKSKCCCWATNSSNKQAKEDGNGKEEGEFTEEEGKVSEEEGKVTNILHQIWRRRLLGHGLMPGGFAPRITAISMGFLLFIEGTIVQTDIVSELADMKIAKGFDGCRAIAKDVPGSRFGRFARTPPVNCLGADSVGGTMGDVLGYVSSGKTFVVMDYSDKVADNIGDSVWAVRVGKGNITIECNPVSSCEVQIFASEAEMNVKNPWLHQNQHILDLKSECSYQCTQFQTLSLKSMVTLSGEIFTGALFLTKFVEWFTAWIGYKLVTESTNVFQITRLLTIARYWRSGSGCWFRWLRSHMRRTLCAVQLLFMLIMAYRLAPSFSKNGMFTSDYYTALIAIFSTCVAAVQRYWNPFWCHPVIYTRKLWTTGEDEFWEHSVGKRKLDLFEWLHMHPTRQDEMLFRYASKISDEEVKEAGDKKRHPCVVCTKEVREICQEEHLVDGLMVPAVRTKVIPANSPGRMMGAPDGTPDGKCQVMWFLPCSGYKDTLKGLDGKDLLKESSVLKKESSVFFTLQFSEEKNTKVEIVDEGTATKNKLEINLEDKLLRQPWTRAKEGQTDPKTYSHGGLIVLCDRDILVAHGREWKQASNTLGFVGFREGPKDMN